MKKNGSHKITWCADATKVRGLEKKNRTDPIKNGVNLRSRAISIKIAPTQNDTSVILSGAITCT